MVSRASTSTIEEKRGEEKRSFCRTSAPSTEESGANNLANCRQRIFKFEHRISLGPPARGHRVNQSEDSSALVRVTKNRIRAFEKGKSTLSFSFCLFLSSPATSLCICMRKSIAAEDWFTRAERNSRYFSLVVRRENWLLLIFLWREIWRFDDEFERTRYLKYLDVFHILE